MKKILSSLLFFIFFSQVSAAELSYFVKNHPDFYSVEKDLYGSTIVIMKSYYGEFYTVSPDWDGTTLVNSCDLTDSGVVKGPCLKSQSPSGPFSLGMDKKADDSRPDSTIEELFKAMKDLSVVEKKPGSNLSTCSFNFAEDYHNYKIERDISDSSHALAFLGLSLKEDSKFYDNLRARQFLASYKNASDSIALAFKEADRRMNCRCLNLEQNKVLKLNQQDYFSSKCGDVSPYAESTDSSGLQAKEFLTFFSTELRDVYLIITNEYMNLLAKFQDITTPISTQSIDEQSRKNNLSELTKNEAARISGHITRYMNEEKFESAGSYTTKGDIQKIGPKAFSVIRSADKNSSLNFVATDFDNLKKLFASAIMGPELEALNSNIFEMTKRNEVDLNELSKSLSLYQGTNKPVLLNDVSNRLNALSAFRKAVDKKNDQVKTLEKLSPEELKLISAPEEKYLISLNQLRSTRVLQEKEKARYYASLSKPKIEELKARESAIDLIKSTKSRKTKKIANEIDPKKYSVPQSNTEPLRLVNVVPKKAPLVIESPLSDKKTLVQSVELKKKSRGYNPYLPHEEDSLFEILTKAYIRNYEKVLIYPQDE